MTFQVIISFFRFFMPFLLLIKFLCSYYLNRMHKTYLLPIDIAEYRCKTKLNIRFK